VVTGLSNLGDEVPVPNPGFVICELNAYVNGRETVDISLLDGNNCRLSIRHVTSLVTGKSHVTILDFSNSSMGCA